MMAGLLLRKVIPAQASTLDAVVITGGLGLTVYPVTKESFITFAGLSHAGGIGGVVITPVPVIVQAGVITLPPNIPQEGPIEVVVLVVAGKPKVVLVVVVDGSGTNGPAMKEKSISSQQVLMPE